MEIKVVPTIALAGAIAYLAANPGVVYDKLSKLPGSLAALAQSDTKNRAIIKQREVLAANYDREMEQLRSLAARISTNEDRALCNADYAKIRALDSEKTFDNPCG